MLLDSDIFVLDNGLYGASIKAWEKSVIPPIPVPPELEKAIEKRIKEFCAGRHCARVALQKLLERDAIPDLGIRADRSPEWPLGVVGAITHCAGFAAAVVGLAEQYHGVGRDSEVIMSEEVASETSSLFATPGEMSSAIELFKLDPLKALTLIFSAKESLYKALAPQVGFFDFSDAFFIPSKRLDNSFQLSLLRPLSAACPKGANFEGKFVYTDHGVHTLCLWPNTKTTN